jgi:hypothetical protein
MKRASQIQTAGIRSGDLEKDLTPKQFEMIGRVAMAYNEAESLVRLIYAACFGVSGDISDEFVSRTNGLDSTVLLAKKAINEFQAHPELQDEFSQSLNAFMELKRYRDGVVHGRIFHVPSGIAKGSLVKGKRDEILLTEEALKGLYERLLCLRDELLSLLLIVISLYIIHTTYRYAPLTLAQRKKQIEPMIRACLPQYRACRARRLSLDPLPTFPDIPEEQQGADITKAFSELLDTLATELGVANYHNPYRKEPEPRSGSR